MLLQFKCVDLIQLGSTNATLIENFNWNPDLLRLGSGKQMVVWEDREMADEIYVIGQRDGTCWNCFK